MSKNSFKVNFDKEKENSNVNNKVSPIKYVRKFSQKNYLFLPPDTRS